MQSVAFNTDIGVRVPQPRSGGVRAISRCPAVPTRTPPVGSCNHRGSRAYAFGVEAESQAAAALERDGWQVLGRRLRTEAGEVDMVAERAGLLAIIEVKARPTLAEAAWCLSARQRARLSSAAEILLAENPGWGREGIRFDVVLVDSWRSVRRISDAFRPEA
ncbi:MAG: YraN family protein [Acetobacteraceae bacterium]|nr:YraN family protein [Acetobacteraceae bacterium]